MRGFIYFLFILLFVVISTCAIYIIVTYEDVIIVILGAGMYIISLTVLVILFDKWSGDK